MFQASKTSRTGQAPARLRPTARVMGLVLFCALAQLAPAAQALAGASEINARAIFLPDAPNYDVVRPIYPAGPAIVDEIKIGPDEVVTKDQVLLTLRSPQLDEKIASTRAALQRRTEVLQQLSDLANQYEGAVVKLENERRQQIREAIATYEKQRDGYRKILDGKSELHSKGLVTSGSNFQAQVQYDQSVNELMKQKLALLEVDSRIAQVQQTRFEKLAPLLRQIEDLRLSMHDLESTYEQLRSVRAPRDGIVNSIFVRKGTSVDSKDILLTLSNAEPTLQAYAFVDIAEVPKWKVGMPVSLTPANPRTPLSQPLGGTIRSISKTPLSKAEARNMFFDDDTVSYLMPDGIVYLVRISLNSDTPHGVVGLGDLATMQRPDSAEKANGAPPR